jgi:hypothetical protein
MVDQINKWIQNDAFPQRVLISGGSEAMEIALETASQLQDASRAKIEKGIHLDTIVFRDKGKSFKIDWSDGAKRDDQGEYENVRGMIRWAHQKPNEGKHRIIVLENFERVSREAPQAMLKLIEEPPMHVIFLFTTKNHHQLLDTIISRMTVVRLPRENGDFEISEDIQSFFNSKNLIGKFQTIDTLDKESKQGKNKKIDRTVFFEFLENCILHARFFEQYRKYLPILFETYQAISKNQNTRFTLERLAVKITN